ncbi:hypothetical protein FHT17_002290 [Novosphingobium sp. SG916]|nr:hypothetical protein [Novosphingobium sp. SG919]NMN87391.1 hypothetical protein [Novosphingobium sp. SG916]
MQARGGGGEVRGQYPPCHAQTHLPAPTRLAGRTRRRRRRDQEPARVDEREQCPNATIIPIWQTTKQTAMRCILRLLDPFAMCRVCWWPRAGLRNPLSQLNLPRGLFQKRNSNRRVHWAVRGKVRPIGNARTRVSTVRERPVDPSGTRRRPFRNGASIHQEHNLDLSGTGAFARIAKSRRFARVDRTLNLSNPFKEDLTRGKTLWSD